MEDMSLREALAEAAKFLAIAAAKDISSLPGQEVLDAVEDLEKVRRLEEGLSSKVVAAVDAQGLWALDGARSLPAWLRNKTGRTDVTSRTAVKNARVLSQHLPGTANALAAGQIGADHAAALARHAATTDRLRQQLRDPDKGEDFLLKHAHTLDATAFTHVVRAWAIAADPDSAERGWREEKDREEVFLSRTTGGWALKGWLSESSGEVLSTAIAAQTGVPSKDDKRTPAQRRADAVVSLARRALDSGALRPGSRIRPHVAVNVSYETLQGLAEATTCPPGSGCGASASDIGASASDIGVPCQHHPEVDEAITTTFDIAALTGKEPPTLPDGAPVPYGLFARLVCGSALHRVVFGPLNRPGMSGDFEPWEGWSHVKEHAVPR